MNFEKEKKNESTSIRTSDDARKLLKITTNYIMAKHKVKVSYSKVIEEMLKDYLSMEEVEYKLSETK